MRLFDELSNIMFHYTPPKEKIKLSKNVNQWTLINVNSLYRQLSHERKLFIKPKYWDLFLAIKMEFCSFEKSQ